MLPTCTQTRVLVPLELYADAFLTVIGYFNQELRRNAYFCLKKHSAVKMKLCHALDNILLLLRLPSDKL